MDLKTADSRLHRYKVAIDALTNAKKALNDSFGIGIEDVEKAIEAQKEALLSHLEYVASQDWWHPSSIPPLISIIGQAERLLELHSGGPVVRLAVKVGELARPHLDPPKVGT